MTHYLEIRLLPDPEFPPTVLMNALFSKLHRVLAQTESHRIGISFPDVRVQPPSLGERLRVHGKLTDLERFLSVDWLAGMRDHSTVRGPSTVPTDATYRIVRRVQAKSNIERLVRRRVKRHGVSTDMARSALSASAAKRLDLPFVTIASHSTGQHFRLFIDHHPSTRGAVEGLFSYYGLSPTATIPWF